MFASHCFCICHILCLLFTTVTYMYYCHISLFLQHYLSFYHIWSFFLHIISAFNRHCLLFHHIVLCFSHMFLYFPHCVTFHSNLPHLSLQSSSNTKTRLKAITILESFQQHLLHTTLDSATELNSRNHYYLFQD